MHSPIIPVARLTASMQSVSGRLPQGTAWTMGRTQHRGAHDIGSVAAAQHCMFRTKEQRKANRRPRAPDRTLDPTGVNEYGLRPHESQRGREQQFQTRARVVTLGCRVGEQSGIMRVSPMVIASQRLLWAEGDIGV